MSDQLLGIVGGGAVAVMIISGIVQLVKALNERKRASNNDGSQYIRAECGLLSGQITTIMTQQTDLLRQLVALTAKVETSVLDAKGVAVNNANKLDVIGKSVSLVLDRQSGRQTFTD